MDGFLISDGTHHYNIIIEFRRWAAHKQGIRFTSQKKLTSPTEISTKKLTSSRLIPTISRTMPVATSSVTNFKMLRHPLRLTSTRQRKRRRGRKWITL